VFQRALLEVGRRTKKGGGADLAAVGEAMGGDESRYRSRRTWFGVTPNGRAGARLRFRRGCGGRGVCVRERERALGWRLLRGQIAQRCSNYEFTAAACSADWSARRARADMTRPSPASHIGSTFLLARQHLRSFF
jgi:hypothetical protein